MIFHTKNPAESHRDGGVPFLLVEFFGMVAFATTLWYNTLSLLKKELVMSNLLIALLILLYTCQSGFCNLYQRHYPGAKAFSSQVYSVFYGIIVAAATLLFARFSFAPSLPTVLLGLFNGAILVLYNFMLIRAAASGPFSIVMLFNIAGGILVPMVWSILVDRAELSVFEYIAIGIMLVSFVFLTREDKKEEVAIKPGFFLNCTFLALANGIYGTILNIQKNLVRDTEDAEMIVITFGMSAVLAMALLLTQAGKNVFPSFRQNGKSTLFLILASLSAATAVNTLMYALGLMNVAVLYAMEQGGVLMVSVLWSAVLLREKLGRNKIVGLLLASIAIFGLGILQSVG